MKKWIAFFVLIALLLPGCSQDHESDHTKTSKNHSQTEVKEYPGKSDIAALDTEYALTKDLFETSAEENGKAGTLYAIYGTVESYSQDEEKGIAYMRISTNHGDVIVYDLIYFFEVDSEQDSYSKSELERMRKYYPIPDPGEFVLIYGEYSEMSEYFGCPTFTYGGQAYFVNVIAASVDTTGGESDSDNDHQATETDDSYNTEIKKYPGDVAGDKIPKYPEILPETVFTTTGEENGLSGKLYMIFGTVEQYIESPDGHKIYLEISTIYGNIIVMDPVEFLKYDSASNTMLSDAGLEKLRDFYPLPDVDEFIEIYAEYQGMSGVYDCPMFLYGSSSYMLDAVVDVAMLGDEYTIE